MGGGGSFVFLQQLTTVAFSSCVVDCIAVAQFDHPDYFFTTFMSLMSFITESYNWPRITEGLDAGAGNLDTWFDARQ